MTLPQKEASSIGVAVEIPMEIKEEGEQAAQRGCEIATGVIRRLAET